MQVNSSAFTDGGAIPSEYAAPPVPGARNISLPLSWSGEPVTTKSFAVSMVDHHPVAHDWVHWVVVSIPPTVTTIPAGASGTSMPPGAIELAGTSGETGYSGPRPPRGSGAHGYEITVYALDITEPTVPPRPTAAQLVQAFDGHVLDHASLTGYVEQR